MHAQHNAVYGGIGLVATERLLYPAHLGIVKLIVRGVVETHEIHPALDPAIVGAKFVIAGIVLQALGAEFGRFQPVGKLLQVVGASKRRDQFVVPDSEMYRRFPKRNELLGDEIVPRQALIIEDAEVLLAIAVLRRGEKVLIEIVDPAEVAEVPVEFGAVAVYPRGNRRHDNIAAVAGITGDRERPALSFLGMREGGQQEQS